MTGLHILVIDDDRDVAESLCEFLNLYEHSVDLAFNGETGIKAALDTDYDFILMDVVLPDINGPDALLAIRKAKPEARVQLTSGYSADELDQNVLDEGASEVWFKPLDLDVISERLAAILNAGARQGNGD